MQEEISEELNFSSHLPQQDHGIQPRITNEEDTNHENLEEIVDDPVKELEQKVLKFRIEENLSLKAHIKILKFMKNPYARFVRTSKKSVEKSWKEFQEDLDIAPFQEKVFEFPTEGEGK